MNNKTGHSILLIAALLAFPFDSGCCKGAVAIIITQQLSAKGALDVLHEIAKKLHVTRPEITPVKYADTVPAPAVYTGEQPAGQPARPVLLGDLLPIIARGPFEGEVMYTHRANETIRVQLSRLFPVPEKIEMTLENGIQKEQWTGHGKHRRLRHYAVPGLSAKALWEYDGWEYSAEIEASPEEPLQIKQVEITPSAPGSVVLPATPEKFIGAVNTLTFLRIKDAEYSRYAEMDPVIKMLSEDSGEFGFSRASVTSYSFSIIGLNYAEAKYFPRFN